jgi:hypothetical protein
VASKRRSDSNKKKKEREDGVAKSGHYYTPIQKHKRDGKRLLASFAQVPNLTLTSWLNDRLPEMIWMALLLERLPRRRVLDHVRGVGVKLLLRGETVPGFDGALSAIATVDEAQARLFLGDLFVEPVVRRALLPLLVLRDLPGRERWTEYLVEEPPDDSLTRFARSILLCDAHKSEGGTDVTWARYMLAVSSGTKPPHPENPTELLNYPNEGDLASVRPMIRASEVMLDFSLKREPVWAAKFWRQWMDETPCAPLPPSTPPIPATGTTLARIAEVRAAVVEHFHRTLRTTALDAKHDASFGLSLYALDTLRELLLVGNATGIVGRAGLRELAEVAITFSYLAHVDQDDVWMQYRVHGAGQAKLAWIKFEEHPTPGSHVDSETLRRMANEDKWQEFVNVDLGHWANLDARKMAQDSGTKDIYDAFYGWPSTFVHGQWCAVRATVLATCANPLHRFHRVPTGSSTVLADVIPDSATLVDRALGVLDRLFPGLTAKSVMTAPSSTTPEGTSDTSR